MDSKSQSSSRNLLSPLPLTQHSRSANRATETERSLQVAEDRVSSPTWIQKILMPREHKRIANELATIRDEQIKDLALEQIQAVASLKETQLDLDADKAKARLRDQYTVTVGEVTRSASIKMVESMKRNLAAESKWQNDVVASDCLPEDIEFLSQLAKGLTLHRIETTARQHKVALDNETESNS
jgi:hypothetical protein